MIYSGTYKITSTFGERTLNGKQEFHNGIDVVGIDSKYVCAVVDGVIGASAMITDRGDRTWEWGNFVRLDGKDGKTYYYCHLDKRLVPTGKRVKAGDHLGIEGNTGYSFGQHCHFEVRNGNGVEDPTAILGIENKVGTYGKNHREEVRTRFGLSEATMKYLDQYQYAIDLYRKLADS